MHAHHWMGERHQNPYLARIFAKAKRLGVEVIAQKIRDGLTERDAYDLEVQLIKQIGRRPNGPLVNGNDGGEGGNQCVGRKFTDEHRAKISAALKGHAVSEKSRETASRVHRGKVISPEHRSAISAAHKGNKYSLGLKPSAKNRAAVIAANKGKPKSAEHRAKIGAAHRRRAELKRQTPQHQMPLRIAGNDATQTDPMRPGSSDCANNP
jgi:NUMOD3 motif